MHPEEFNTMVAQKLLREMERSAQRAQQWERFADQVRTYAQNLVRPEQMESALQGLHQELLVVQRQAAQERWPEPQTDETIRKLIFGESGRRPITAEFVAERFGWCLIEPQPSLGETHPPARRPDSGAVITADARVETDDPLLTPDRSRAFRIDPDFSTSAMQ
jgi:hypothetical protein